MGVRRAAGAALAALCIPTYAGTASSWRLALSDHFEVYAQGTEDHARSAVLWFEQLRVFFLQQTWLKTEPSFRVRVIAFGSLKEYERYRLRSMPDAYFVGTDSQDYIVLPPAGIGSSGMGVHEYTHVVLHGAGLQLPAWLDEGLAELYSTVRVGEHSSELGGELLARVQLLQRHAWIPLQELLTLPVDWPARGDHGRAGVFYAQSWALADMLLLSPEYGPRFQQLIEALRSGRPSPEAVKDVYAKGPEDIERDLHSWVERHRFQVIHLPGVIGDKVPVAVSEVSHFASQSLLAELLAATGELDRAETIYRDLLREVPGAAAVSAALGTIAFRRGDHDRARSEWKRAIGQGITDAALCYRYAVLADMAGLPEREIRPALERAVELKPDFDDARYTLALLEKNTGHYDAAVAHLRAMRSVAPGRAHSYWITIAYALNELGEREEAIAAAKQAADHATTASERRYAAEVAYLARTDLTVQFATDSNGRAQMVTTRKPHGTSDWNPFIEPGDDERSVQAKLREIDCSAGVTRLVVEAAGLVLRLAIADPARVQMRNAPAELVCGKQKATNVLVEYAASKKDGVDGLVRGVEFQ